jgi:hypothetical protein
LYIIDAHKGFALRHVARHSHIMHTIHWNETPRTGAATKITDAG